MGIGKTLSLAVVIVTGASALAPTAGAGEVATCDHDALTGTVVITLTEGYVNVRRKGDAITWNHWEMQNYEQCDGATVHNTDEIIFDDNAGEFDRYFHIDQSGGRFVPGMTEEPTVRSEIEFTLDYDGRDYESMFAATGTHGDDKIVAGDNGLLLNRDGDRDVTIDHAGFYEIRGARGDDRISFRGGKGTGDGVGPSEFFENALEGGRGSDRLFGGPGLNNISGGHGHDHLEGLGGPDYLFGGDGNDHLDGDKGSDVCKGGPGKDTREDCED